MENKAIIAGRIEHTGIKFLCKDEEFERIFVYTERKSGVVDRISAVMPVILDNKAEKAELIGEVRMRTVINEDNTRSNDVFFFVTRINEYKGYDENDVRIEGVIVTNKNKRDTPKGRQVIDFTLAYNKTNRSHYIPCIAWGRKTLIVEETSVGSNIVIRGRFQSREYIKKYEDDTQETKTAYEISCSYVATYAGEE